jgi:hypothetical protein
LYAPKRRRLGERREARPFVRGGVLQRLDLREMLRGGGGI